MNTGVQKYWLGYWAWVPRAVAGGEKGCDDFNGGGGWDLIPPPQIHPQQQPQLRPSLVGILQWGKKDVRLAGNVEIHNSL